jgi:hypothetical protein
MKQLILYTLEVRRCTKLNEESLVVWYEKGDRGVCHHM